MSTGSTAQPEVKVADSQPTVPGNESREKNNPDAALEELLAGNRRFTSGRTSSHRRDLAILQQMMEKPEPFAAVLSCADSRVPVELVFAAFNSNRTPHIPGQVLTVAADRSQDERTGTYYYKIDLKNGNVFSGWVAVIR